MNLLDPAEAQLHIERLRNELPEGHPEFECLIANSLDVLVNQLYDRSTHFIMEFIQNMDDTAYADSVMPAVKFTYTPGRLRIDSNQIGFGMKDINAICSIGSSTKNDRKSFKNSIGEKGIGFKSVFRLAKSVWLSSRSYSVRWDRAARLGVLLPDWAVFPEPVANGHTVFLLDLEQNEQEDQVVEELEHFDPVMILFLNRLRNVDIELHSANGHVLSKSFRRKIETRSPPITKVLMDGDTETHFLETRFGVENLPLEARRPGRCSSELILASPVPADCDMSPPSTTTYVYSGLPIESHGLNVRSLVWGPKTPDTMMLANTKYLYQFLVNADFILTASRQSIDVSRPWNIALRDAMPMALIKAIEEMTVTSRMRYAWPWLITDPGPSSFFASAMIGVRRTLKSMKILESYDGCLRVPTELTFVDPGIFGVQGQVATLSPLTESRYLSSKYPSWTIDAAIALGVKRLTNATFLDDFDHMISVNPTDFQQKPSKWHEELAKKLLPLVDDPNSRGAIEQVRIIPLLNGDWVSAASGKHAGFWPINIDSGISEQRTFQDVTIHHDAARQDARRTLFERLGMKTLGPRRICPVIMNMHADAGPESLANLGRFSSHELISQVLFLHRSSYTPARRETNDLWFVTSDGRRCRGRQTYIRSDSAEDSSANRVSAMLSKEFPVLHDHYHDSRYKSQMSDPEVSNDISGSNTSEDLTTYLVSVFGLSKSTTPRLVRPNPKERCDFTLSDEFQYLFSTCPTSDVLEVILHNWTAYSAWIQPDGLHECSTCNHSRENTLTAIRSTPAKGIDRNCIYQQSSQFWTNWQPMMTDLVLTDIDPLIQSDAIPLATLKIPNSQSATVRRLLECLGVAANKGASFYMRCLYALTRQKLPEQEDIAYVYEQLQAFYEDDKDIIESGFLKDDLIFLNRSSRITGECFRGWHSLTRCIFSLINLENEYPRSARLFRHLQAADGLGVDGLKKRLISLTSASSCVSDPSDIMQTLNQISKAISDMSEKGAALAVRDLRTRSVFPVTLGKTVDSCQLRSCLDDDWYIADRLDLHDSFLGMVALLCTPDSQFGEQTDLIRALGLDAKRLSAPGRVTTTTFPKGPIKLRYADTVLLRFRVPFIELVIPETEFSATTLDQLRTATVSSAADIVETHTLHGKNDIPGRDGYGQAVSQVEGESLRLFVSARSSSNNPLTLLTEPLLELCEIANPIYIRLFHILLSERNDAQVDLAFAKRGLHPKVSRLQQLNGQGKRTMKKSVRRYRSDAMDFMDPSDLVVSERDSSGNESTDEDLLQNVYRDKKDCRGTKSLVQKQDRRLNFLMRRSAHDGGDETDDLCEGANRRLDIDLDLMFLGENLVSTFFHRELGIDYNPLTCWTSHLRSRAGLESFPDSDSQTSFTMAERNVATRMTRFLYDRGWKSFAMGQFLEEVPTYHFDVSVSVGGLDDTFQYGTSQLRRAQEYRPLFPPNQNQSRRYDVLILIRITNVYLEPQYHFVLDPWSHFASGRLQLQSGWIVPANFNAVLRINGTDGGNKTKETQVREAKTGPTTSLGGSTDSSTNTARPVVSGHRLEQSQGGPKEPMVSISASMNQVVDQSQRLDAIPSTLVPPGGGCGQVEWGSLNHRNTLERQQTPKAASSCRLEAPRIIPSANTKRFISTNPTYPYNSLRPGQIRLFTLFPGDLKDDLKGLIWTTAIERSGSYVTLSYVWGSPEQNTHLLRTVSGILSITDSLRSALIRLRRTREPLVLWVDAICINQTDDKEKSSQIILLPQIFQRSAVTLAYFDGEDHSLALQMLMQVHAARVLGPASKTWPPNIPRCPSAWGKTGMPSCQDPVWDKVADFFRHAWFRRSWIIQEAVIARNLQITHGDCRVDWDHLFSVMTHIDQNLERSGAINWSSWVPFLKLGKLRRMEGKQSRSSLLKLLENFRYVQSTDLRDRFFSLLGIASDGHLDELEPDYSIPFEDVAKRYAVALFRRFASQKQAMLLLYPAGLDSQSVDLPSWIPNWLIEKPNGLHETLERGTEFDASRGVEEQVEYVPETDELTVATSLVAKIAIVSDSANEARLLARHEFFSEIESLLQEVFGDIWTPEQRQKVLYEAPIAGAIHPKFAESGDLSVPDSWEAFRKVLKRLSPPSSDEETRGAPSSTSPASKENDKLREQSRVYESLLGDEVRGWRFIILERCQAGDLCGIAPNSVQEGDLVRIFHGGRVPFITRASKERPGTERLVGQCYILGIMQGQILEGGRAIDLPETVRLY